MTAHDGPRPKVGVIVCGNVDRGDDGLAPAAIAVLRATLPPRLMAALDIRPATELRVEDLIDLPSDAACLIVDAVAGVEPGQVVRLSLRQLGDPSGFTPRSSHQLPIDLVVGLAGILRERPVEGTFVGLGGLAFDYGTALSTVTRGALPAFADAIERELSDLVLNASRSAPAQEAVV
jgi:hydrogenase maturation protease